MSVRPLNWWFYVKNRIFRGVVRKCRGGYVDSTSVKLYYRCGKISELMSEQLSAQGIEITVLSSHCKKGILVKSNCLTVAVSVIES